MGDSSQPKRTAEELRRAIDEAQASLSALGDDLRDAYERLKDARREAREAKRYNYRVVGGYQNYLSDDNAERVQGQIDRIQERRDDTRTRLVELRAALRALGGSHGARNHPDEPRLSGVVKWYSEEKGFGFITVVGQPDVFVGKSALRESASLEVGDRVTFKRTTGLKGHKAVDVRFVSA